MAEKKGSTSKAVENNIYIDLNLSRYPKDLDTRAEQVQGGNENLHRQENLVDYNYAEHVNALQDAVMTIQRSLGTRPQLPTKAYTSTGQLITTEAEKNAYTSTHTVSDRIGLLEKIDWLTIFDKRYGGPNWRYVEGASTNPTIQQHKHSGAGNGMPGKISLTAEVSGLLPKANVDLSNLPTGITGADILVEPTNTTKIKDAINDKISETTGGIIAPSAELKVLGKTNTRWAREFDANDGIGTGNSAVADSKTLLNKAIKSDGTASSNLLEGKLTGMHYGRYVAMVRVATTNKIDANLLEISALDKTGKSIASTLIKGTDFGVVNEYKTFYLIFENTGDATLRVRKVATTSNASVSFDHAIVESVHPAVFDR